MTYHGMQPDVFDATDLADLIELREEWQALRDADLELAAQLGRPQILVIGHGR